MSQINETLSKMQHLMYYKSEEKPVERQNSLEFMREGVDNKVYGIVHEGTSYYIKVAEKQDGKKLMPENFDYVGGFVNRGRMKYSSYTDALKNLDMHLQEVRTSLGKKTIVIESTNPEYKETLITTATGELAEEIKRQRQIMANVKVIEEGAMMIAPIGKEIGKAGDSTPFGDKNIETNKVTDGEGFSEKAKDAKENGEPANATAKSVETAKDGLKDVPGAKDGVKAAEKPVMKEDKDFDEEPAIDATDIQVDADVEPKDDAEKDNTTPNEDTHTDTDACNSSIEDKLQTILDRLSDLENKVDKIPFNNDEIVPADDEEGAGDADAVPGDADAVPGDADAVPGDADADVDIDLSITDDEEPQQKPVKESFDGTDVFDDDVNIDDEDADLDIEKRFPWLSDADDKVAAAEQNKEAEEAAKADIAKSEAEEEAIRQADEDAMI